MAEVDEADFRLNSRVTAAAASVASCSGTYTVTPGLPVVVVKPRILLY